MSLTLIVKEMQCDNLSEVAIEAYPSWFEDLCGLTRSALSLENI